MSQITYTNKETFNAQPSIADKNKVTSDDMNEIKSVVNENDTRLTTVETYIDNLNTYSTTEQVVGMWIDGKPLYRKTFSIGEITSSADITVETGILNCDTITQMSGNFKRKKFEYLRYGLDSNYLGEVHFDSNAGVFSIRSGTPDVGFSSGVITMEYTKTTD